jgi:hypothetical protein
MLAGKDWKDFQSCLVRIFKKKKMILDQIRELLDVKEQLDASPDIDGTKMDQEVELKEELEDELTDAVFEAGGNGNIGLITDKASELLVQLSDEMTALGQVKDIPLNEKNDIETKLENQLFTSLVETKPNEKMPRIPNNISEELFIGMYQ